MAFKSKFDKMVDVKKSEEEFKETLKKTPLEKGDLPAMIIASLIVFLPALLIVIGFVLLFVWFFFWR